MGDDERRGEMLGEGQEIDGFENRDYVGVLDRLRFAVDPLINRFYFGQLG